MWLFDSLFGRKVPEVYNLTDPQKILCSIHTRMQEGALTIQEVVKDLGVRNSDKHYYHLVKDGYLKPWMLKGRRQSYLITKDGEHYAVELKGFLAEDGLPLLADH